MRSRFCQPKAQHLSVSISQLNYSPLMVSFKPNKQRIDIHQSCRIFQNMKTKVNKYITLQQAKKGKIPVKDHNIIASIDINCLADGKKKYMFNKPCPYTAHQSTTQIFSSLRNYSMFNDHKGYQLSQGDVIKIGKKKLRIVAIRSKIPQIIDDRSMIDELSENLFQARRNYNKIQPSQKFKFNRKYWDCYFQQQNQTSGTCRICLSDQIDQTDFMITPCQCKGSCATMHFSCLKQWVSQKMAPTESRIGKLITYSTKHLKCEVCKSPLPKCLLKDGEDEQKFNYLFNIPALDSPYLLAEIEGEPALYLMNPKADNLESHKIVVGRSITSDIIMWETYVSKLHCQISYFSGNFYIKDLHSEIGTFVELRQQMEIVEKFEIEADGSLYEFKVEKDYYRYNC